MSVTSKIIPLSFEKPFLELNQRILELSELSNTKAIDVSKQVQQLELRVAEIRQEIFSNLSAIQRVQIARHSQRPRTLDYIQIISDEWVELHGDRCGSDDTAIVGGVARIDDQAIVILGHQKGRNAKDNVVRNFGMASPGGYRKALRLMKHADRFGIPIITLIDTPGAWPGIEAESLGQGEAIAQNLQQMFQINVPIICTVIGEGGSGGALGIGVGDRLLMFEHAVYTVASPEACASILWKNALEAPLASDALKLTAQDLQKLGVVDEILPEPMGGAHNDPIQAADTLKKALLHQLQEISRLTHHEISQLRYQKYRNIGDFIDKF